MGWRARWAVLGAAAVLAGCATAPPAVFTLTVSPRVEALSYFPSSSPAVAMVSTDADDPQWRRLIDDGGLRPLLDVADAEGLRYVQLQRLLGHELVVGLPRVGASPLAVLVVSDQDQLRTLAQARVIGRRAAPAGRYRGAELYAGSNHAFAVRGPVLLVARTTADLRHALDTRSGDDSFDRDVLRRALPAGGATGALVRAYVDLRPVIARAPAAIRALPLVAALQSAGLVLRVRAGVAMLDGRADTSGGELVELDVPISPGGRAPLAADVRGTMSVSVRDLAYSVSVAERVGGRVAPLAALRLAVLRDALRRVARVDLDSQLLGRLHGAATLALTRDGLLLRAQPSRPERLRRVLGRIARRFARAVRGTALRRVTVTRLRGLLEVRHDHRLVFRAGVIDGVLVAGRARPRALRALARAPLARPAGAAGALTFKVPARVLARHGLPGRDLTGWLRYSGDELDASLAAALSP